MVRLIKLHLLICGLLILVSCSDKNVSRTPASSYRNLETQSAIRANNSFIDFLNDKLQIKIGRFKRLVGPIEESPSKPEFCQNFGEFKSSLEFYLDSSLMGPLTNSKDIQKSLEKSAPYMDYQKNRKKIEELGGSTLLLIGAECLNGGDLDSNKVETLKIKLKELNKMIMDDYRLRHELFIELSSL